MTVAELERIAKEWIESFKEHDIEKLLALYHDNATHYSPRVEERDSDTKGWLRGKNQLREWWQDSFEKLEGLEYELTSLAFGPVVDGEIPHPSEVYMKYIRRVTDQPAQEVMEYFKIENGLIIESRVLRSWQVEE